jgi:predicted TIM-barrel fold metal-dependent hydrolase
VSLVADSRSAKVRSQLSHPVVDCDGHWQEHPVVLLDYVTKIGGSRAADALAKLQNEEFGNGWYALSPGERLRQRRTRPGWWTFPAHNTLDRATAMMPDLLYQRLDEFGIDFAIVLPTSFSTLFQVRDPELRKAVVRAANVMHAEAFAAYSERMTPAATIPTNTPEEAIEEAEYVVKELGLKVAMINGSLRRPVPAYAEGAANPSCVPYFIDNLALDSAYDYDPLWAKFVELKLSPMTHSGSFGWVDRSSPNNFVFNHTGHFAQAAHSFARAVYLGGVTRRFPTLKFAFLEGGVGWARNLCSDLALHWEKRNEDAMLAHMRPTNLDIDRLSELLKQYGSSRMTSHLEGLLASPDVVRPRVSLEELTNREEVLDDFAAVGVHSKEEAAAEFARNFYFGCESDDPMTALAFDPRLGPKLKPLFSSDISHFDVTDMTEVLEEAYELVEHGLIDMHAFREFTFSNTVDLHAGVNPDFFKGTAVESAAKEELDRMAAIEESSVKQSGI